MTVILTNLKSRIFGNYSFFAGTNIAYGLEMKLFGIQIVYICFFKLTIIRALYGPHGH